MTPELESQLRRMFADLDEELPAPEFTSRVLSAALGPRRRELWVRLSAVAAALVFTWLAFPYLEAGLGMVVRSSRMAIVSAGDAVAALEQTLLLCVYGVPLAGYLLLRLMRRLS